MIKKGINYLIVNSNGINDTLVDENIDCSNR